MQGRFGSIGGEVGPFLVAHPEHRLFVGLERVAGGGRAFFVFSDGRAFVDEFRRARGTWHEYVIPDRPVKLFFDLDDRKKREGWEELLRSVHNCVANALGREPEMRVWEAHTAAKLSCHLVFPDVWFDCAASLAVFAKDVHARLGRDDRIDTQVYTESPAVFKSLRAPYAASPGRDNHLRPRGGPAEFDADWFVESLVTQGEVPDASLLLKFEAPPREGSAFVPDEDTDPARLAALARVEAWLRLYLCADKVVLKQKLDAGTGRWLWHVTPGLWCPFKRRRHLKNNTMVRGTMTLDRFVRLETYCLDEQCCRWVENRDYDWGAIAFPMYAYNS